MPQNRSYPAVKRSAAIGKGFPSRSRDIRNPFEGTGPKAAAKAGGGKTAKKGALKPKKRTR